MVTVYTKPRCVQCTATKRTLDKAGVEFVEVDLTADTEALEHLKALGYSQAPLRSYVCPATPAGRPQPAHGQSAVASTRSHVGSASPTTWRSRSS